jgi:hypothetical protein
MSAKLQEVCPNNEMYNSFQCFDSKGKFRGNLILPRYTERISTRELSKLDTDGLKATDASRPPHLDNKALGSNYVFDTLKQS